MAPSSVTTCRAKTCHYSRCSRPSSVLLPFVAIAVVALFASSADCQSEKRHSSAQHQQKSYYVDSDDGAGEVIKSKIRPDSYSQDSLSHNNNHQSDSVGSASTVYGEQYGSGVLMQHDQPLLDEEAQESISSGSMNNHRIPQYTRGGSDSVEGKNVGNRATSNNYHQSAVINNNPSSNSGYAVDSAYNPHFSTQDLIQDQNYQLEFKYHDYDKMTKFLRTTSSKFPNLTALYSIGKSVQGIMPFFTYFNIYQFECFRKMFRKVKKITFLIAINNIK